MVTKCVTVTKLVDIAITEDYRSRSIVAYLKGVEVELTHLKTNNESFCCNCGVSPVQ